MGARVLVVDDDDSIRRLVATVLRRRKIDADEARNGHEAIEKLSRDRYDVLFLDLMMPVCDGFEVLAYLRDKRAEPQRVVVMTAAGPSRTLQLDRFAVHRVLQKPFRIDEVIAVADELRS